MLPGKGDCRSFLPKEVLSFFNFPSGLLRKILRLKKELQPRNPPLYPLMIPFVYISLNNNDHRVGCHCVTVGTNKFLKIHFYNVNRTCLYSFQLIFMYHQLSHPFRHLITIFTLLTSPLQL